MAIADIFIKVICNFLLTDINALVLKIALRIRQDETLL